MTDLLLLYPNRKSYPKQLKETHDVLDRFSIEVRSLREQNAVLQRMLFGQRSERTPKKETAATVAHPGPGTENANDVPADVKKNKTRKPRNRNKDNYNHPGRNALPADLIRKRVECDLDPQDKVCPHCHAELTKIGEEIVEKLGAVPIQFFVWLYARLKYACRNCGQHVALAKIPNQPIDKGSMDVDVLALIVMGKYQDYLPLYRIQRQFAREGIHVARSTLADQMGYVAQKLKPIYDAMNAELLSRDHLFTDATPMPFLDPGAGKTRKGKMWTVVGKEGQNQKAVALYCFKKNGKGENILEILKGFTGYLQTDRDPVYDALIKWDKKNPEKIPQCKQVGCMAHVRRKFVNALTYDPLSIASEILIFIHALYENERYMKEKKMTEGQRCAYRRKYSKPIVKEMHHWLKKNKAKAPPSTLLGKAMTYATNAMPYLVTFLERGYLEIDNNRAERAMKPPVMLRKNALFAGSQEGGETAAILLSFCETCRLNDINIFEYLTDVLKGLPTHPKDRMHELMPQYWQPLQTEPAATLVEIMAAA